MKHENLRLRPTILWLIFGPILGCMWVAAVNYSNNLVYAILYLIAALSFISLFHTWRNLTALRVEHVRIHPAFAGESVRVEIFLRNTTERPIYGFFFARSNDAMTDLSLRSTPLRAVNNIGVRLAPGDSCSTEVTIAKRQTTFRWGRFRSVNAPGSGEERGLYRFGSLLVRTSFPFGLFWASLRVPVEAEYYVYPKPKGGDVWPALQPGGDQGSPSSNRPGDDFSGDGRWRSSSSREAMGRSSGSTASSCARCRWRPGSPSSRSGS
jgi:uncharacterized protein (DUF58 family)